MHGENNMSSDPIGGDITIFSFYHLHYLDLGYYEILDISR